MKTKKRIRVLIVDDHFVMRIGFKTTINLQPDMQVVAEASTGAEALELVRRHEPDVILMDLRLPGMSGFEVIAALMKDFPNALIIAISTYEGEEDIFRALQLGARTYLTKSVLEKELADAIRAVHSGGNYVPPLVAARLAERTHHPQLSTREISVLERIVKGHSNKEVAGQLFITEATVKLHVTNILAKLGVQDRTQASTVAIQRGIVHLD
jgi:DNA-binding NarL/FixJ family response regulator